MKIRISLIKKLSICFFATVYTIVTIGCSSKGIKAFQKGDYDTALEVLEGTTSNGSADFVDEFWFLGLTYEALGDYENAEKYKDKAFNICQKSKSDAKDFSKKYPDAYKQLLEYGKTNNVNVGLETSARSIICKICSSANENPKASKIVLLFSNSLQYILS